jgi:hypothetical protein
MSKVIFTGCSFTAGNGWVELPPTDSEKLEYKDCPNLWVNLCHSQLAQIKDLDLINCGQSGASNTEIFKNTVNAISEYHHNIDIIFCQWTSMPRYKFNVGFELWDTTEAITPGSRSKADVNLSNGTKWNRKYLDELLDRLLVLHHAHNEIINVVTYSNILQRLAKSFAIKLYFINGLCPWDQDYFTRLSSNVLPENYTPFTKNEILEIDSRSDEDIFKLYNKLHNNYDNAGGIDPTQWINLYSSMLNNKIDVNYDKKHPGTQSNQLYFEQIKKFLETQ